MKKILLTLSITIGTACALLAQEQKVFQINYQPIMQGSENNADEKHILVSVNKDVFRVSYSGNTQIEIYDKKTLNSYSLDPDSKNYFLLYSDADGGSNYASLPLTYIQGQEKTIAGYRCKLAEIAVSAEMAEFNGEKSIKVWYSEEIPKIYWSQLDYLQILPGAPLLISYAGNGFEAKSVESKTLANNLFVLPPDYSLLEVEAAIEETTEAADDISEMEMVTVEGKKDLEGLEGLEEYEAYEIDSVEDEGIPEEDLLIDDNRFTYFDAEAQLSGVKDENDNYLTKALYQSIGYYNEGIAIVIDKNGLYGAINRDGKTTIPCRYQFLNYDDKYNQYLFAEEESHGLLNADGSIFIPAKYSSITFMADGLIEFLDNGLWGLMDEKQNVIIPASYESIYQRNKTHFIVSIADKYQVYSIKDNKPIGTTYSFMALPNEGDIFLVYEAEKYGFINGQGKLIIPMKFSYATPFSSGVSMVTESENLDGVYYINTQGQTVADPTE